MSKRFLVIIVALVVIFGAIFGFRAFMNHQRDLAMASAPPPPVFVSAKTVAQQDWQPTLEAVGSVKAVNGVDVTTQIAGQVKAIYFKSGQTVKKGDLLVYLDDATEVQQLNNYLAALRLSELDLKRKKVIYQSGGISKSTLDTALSTYQEDLANAKYTQAEIDYKHIKAPFSGVVGIRAINLGEYLSPGTSIVTLESMDPLYVDFQVPERYLTSLSVGRDVALTVDAHPGKTFMGHVKALNSTVSTDNRNVSVRAEFSNKDHQLYPGLFAAVKVHLPKQTGVLTVPATAVTYSLYGSTVFVLTKESSSGKDHYRVSQVPVTVGDQKGNTVVILKGLKKGEMVATSGQTKLHKGMMVQLNNVVPLSPLTSSQLDAQ